MDLGACGSVSFSVHLGIEFLDAQKMILRRQRRYASHRIAVLLIHPLLNGGSGRNTPLAEHRVAGPAGVREDHLALVGVGGGQGFLREQSAVFGVGFYYVWSFIRQQSTTFHPFLKILFCPRWCFHHSRQAKERTPTTAIIAKFVLKMS